jgi:hypothetical protein
MTLVVDRLQDDGTGNSDAVQDFIDGRAKAWVRSSNSANPDTSFNVSSGTDNSTGNYAFDLINSMDQTGYPCPSSAYETAGTIVNGYQGQTSKLNVAVFDDAANAKDDRSSVCIFGTLA